MKIFTANSESCDNFTWIFTENITKLLDVHVSHDDRLLSDIVSGVYCIITAVCVLFAAELATGKYIKNDGL